MTEQPIRLGREWARLAVRHEIMPTATGHTEHDRACAEEYMRITGTAPAWYDPSRHGFIFDAYSAVPWFPPKSS